MKLGINQIAVTFKSDFSGKLDEWKTKIFKSNESIEERLRYIIEEDIKRLK